MRESGRERESGSDREREREREPAVVRMGLAVMAGCVVAVGLYAVLRIVQGAVGREPDPALVIWSEHAGFFWRSWIVVYVGGMAAFLTWVASAKNAPAVVGVLATALPIAAVLLAAQAAFVP